MKIEVDYDDLYQGKIDGQGRKYIYPELAGKNVTVALVEVNED